VSLFASESLLVNNEIVSYKDNVKLSHAFAIPIPKAVIPPTIIPNLPAEKKSPIFDSLSPPIPKT
jgi:hypothetical protein